VRLDFETIRDGRPWSEWDVWFAAMKFPAVKPASTLRFSHYDQVIPAAIEGSGVAMGARPHLTHHLRDGVLCAPFGPDAVATLGSFFIVLRRNAAGSDAVEAFLEWLRSEVRQDGELTLAPPRVATPSPSARTQASGARTRARRT
jgi:DNA-binding transcriptional LysR family regulator